MPADSCVDGILKSVQNEIVSITEDTIKNKTGFTPKVIMDKIKLCFLYSEIKIKKEYWNSYDVMNDLIIARIEGR